MDHGVQTGISCLGYAAVQRLKSSITTPETELRLPGYFDLVAWGGIEPPTQGFSVLCSTN